jgi:hypothetical protein
MDTSQQKRVTARLLRAALRRLPALLCLGVAVGMLVSVFLSMRRTIWCYYTDDVSIRQDASEADIRLVLWEDP